MITMEGEECKWRGREGKEKVKEKEGEKRGRTRSLNEEGQQRMGLA